MNEKFSYWTAQPMIKRESSCLLSTPDIRGITTLIAEYYGENASISADSLRSLLQKGFGIKEKMLSHIKTLITSYYGDTSTSVNRLHPISQDCFGREVWLFIERPELIFPTLKYNNHSEYRNPILWQYLSEFIMTQTLLHFFKQEENISVFQENINVEEARKNMEKIINNITTQILETNDLYTPHEAQENQEISTMGPILDGGSDMLFSLLALLPIYKLYQKSKSIEDFDFPIALTFLLFSLVYFRHGVKKVQAGCKASPQAQLFPSRADFENDELVESRKSLCGIFSELKLVAHEENSSTAVVSIIRPQL